MLRINRAKLYKIAILVFVCCVLVIGVFISRNASDIFKKDEPLSDDAPPQEPQDEEGFYYNQFTSPYGTLDELKVNCPLDNVSQCLTYLDTQKPRERRLDRVLLFHTAWIGKISPVHTFLLKSFLATQDLSRSILVFWTDADSYQRINNSTFFVPFQNHPNIIFKLFDIKALARGSPLDNDSPEHSEHVKSLLNAQGALFGDLIRMLLLYRFGGVYLDADVILLRPFNVLLVNEFAYSWSGYNAPNTAVFRLRRNGTVVRELMDFVVSERKKNFHPFVLEEGVKARNLSLFVYPATFFDPAWLISDGFSPVEDLPFSRFDGLFQSTDRWNGKFWSGAYAYHFHNQYDKINWPEDSWIGHLEKEWEMKIARLPPTETLQNSLSKNMNEVLNCC